MTMFSKLELLRAEIDAIPAFALTPDHLHRLVERLKELDDAMVLDIRTRTYMKSLPAPSPAYTLMLLARYEKGPRPLTALGPDDDTRDPDEIWDEHLQWKHKTQDKYND